MISVLFAVLALLLPAGTYDIGDDVEDRIDSSVVLVSRAGELTPVANTFIDKTQLRHSGAASSLPMVLRLQPSVVSTMEGGTPLGYSSIRIRGVGGYQTNVTLGGITLNDAESQEVFWVNIPALSAILGSVQLQRGLGTVSSGPGSFGAGIDMAAAVSDVATGGLDFSAGSFGTLSATVSAATGVLESGFYADASYSLQHSDGYILNAPADVQSVYAVAGWKNAANSVRFTFLQGRQRTGITWEGVPFDIYPVNRRYNAAPGATDNYLQNHFQLNYVHSRDCGPVWSATFNYSSGRGHYAYPDTKDALRNGLYVIRSDVKGCAGNLEYSAGAYLSHYCGLHFGEIGGSEWYRNKAVKNEADLWQRLEWKVSDKLLLYEELQYRGVLHNMHGPDEYSQILDFNEVWNFLSPRLGMNLKFSGSSAARVYAAMGNREPSRSDLQAYAGCRPERMYDFEAAYTYSGRKFAAEANLFAMEYRDMLLETGELNAAGYAIKSNVSKGYRRGIELSAAVEAASWLRLDGNACISDNRYDSGKMILLSPSLVAGAQVAADLPLVGLFNLNCRYVGRQYWDNSSRTECLVPAYFTVNLSYNRDFFIRIGASRQMRLSPGFFLDNLLNRKYYAYAYSGGVYPAPPLTFSFRLSLSVY